MSLDLSLSGIMPSSRNDVEAQPSSMSAADRPDLSNVKASKGSIVDQKLTLDNMGRMSL